MMGGVVEARPVVSLARAARDFGVAFSLAVTVGLMALMAGSAEATTGAREPALIRSVDPLSLPRPDVEVLLGTEGTAAGGRIASPRLLSLAEGQANDSVVEIIVLLREPLVPYPQAAGIGERDALRAQHLAALQHDFVGRAALHGFSATNGMSHLPIVVGEAPLAALTDLLALPEVVSIEEVLEVQALRVEGGSLIKATSLKNEYGGRGAGVGVAVLDSGIDWTHPELDSRVSSQGDYTGTRADGFDDHGHGTSVAGIIAGEASGVAPNAHLHSYKVLDSSLSGSNATTIAGLNSVYAYRNDFGGTKVVNMSAGGYLPSGPSWGFCDHLIPTFAAAVDQLKDVGITVFAASGNGGCVNGIAMPACLTGTISVGAVYDDNVGSRGPFSTVCGGSCSDTTTSTDQITCYSDSGEALDLLAPSHCATTPKLGGGNANCFGGTSAAAPYATGVAAQLLSIVPHAAPLDILVAMATTGKSILDVNQITRSRIDAVEAYQLLSGGSGGGGGGGAPPPPYTTWISSTGLPGYQVQVRITGGSGGIQGLKEGDCIAETICVSGAVAGRPEVFFKVIGPRPNGYLWVQVPRFTPSQVEVWARQTKTGKVNYYKLAPAAAGSLSGLEDREAFLP